jgi:hypothetical protein
MQQNAVQLSSLWCPQLTITHDPETSSNFGHFTQQVKELRERSAKPNMAKCWQLYAA